MADLSIRSGAASRENANIIVLDVGGIPIEQVTFKAASDIKAGAAIRLDATGKAVEADASTAANANIWGIAIKTAKAGQGVTAIKRGVLAGFDLTALAYGASVFLSNTVGRLADAAGTVSKVVGRVYTMHGQTPGNLPMKAIYIEL